MSVLEKLVGHLRWADALILEALRRAKEPPEKALEIYGHILGAEHVWLARVRGHEPEVAVWPAIRVEDCARVADENAHLLEALLTSATKDSLQLAVRYRNSAGAEFHSQVDDIILHVALHGQYHRSQVNTLLRDAGLEPAAVDYIAFVRGVPAATWPPSRF